MGKKDSHRRRSGVVYSTDPDYEYKGDQAGEQETLPPAAQRLKIRYEKKGRKGKPVTLVEGFVGTEEDLLALAQWLKTRCGCGGSAKEGQIMLQGDKRDAVGKLLSERGFGR